MNITASNIIQFDLPKHLSCPEPTEERNMQRDEVRLLVTDSNGNIHHSTFKFLDNFLREGDVLVVNTSATIPAALPLSLPGGRKGKLHLSTRIEG